MFKSCLCTGFYMPSHSSSLVIAMKLKAKESVGTAAILFYIIQKYYLNKNCMLFQDLLHVCNCKTVSVVNVTATWQVVVFVMLSLLILGNYNLSIGVPFSGFTSYHVLSKSVSLFKSSNEQMHRQHHELGQLLFKQGKWTKIIVIEDIVPCLYF
jgi:hypothetical protein